jgi:hypothetical protein
MKVSSQLQAPTALPPEKSPPVPIKYESGRYGEEKILAWPGIEPLVVQPVSRRYSD